jgi:hypothetical protein
VIVTYIGIDSIIFPIFRPTSRWLGGRSLVRSAQRRVAKLPPYVILGFLALPFAIAEPAKVFALYLIATGQVLFGLLVLVGAYFVSLVVVERLFRGGRTKLLTIPWFKAAWRWLMACAPQHRQIGTLNPNMGELCSNQGRMRRHAHLARFRARVGRSPSLEE